MMLKYEEPRKMKTTMKGQNNLTTSYIRPETDRGDLTNNSRVKSELDDTEFARSIRTDRSRP